MKLESGEGFAIVLGMVLACSSRFAQVILIMCTQIASIAPMH
jgi:hypothetical protein